MNRVEVITRPRTLSGKRGHLRLFLEPAQAREWIEKRWADPVDKGCFDEADFSATNKKRSAPRGKKQRG